MDDIALLKGEEKVNDDLFNKLERLNQISKECCNFELD